MKYLFNKFNLQLIVLACFGLLSPIFYSCTKYIDTEYKVLNKYSDTIKIHVCGIIYSYFNGEEEKCYTYYINPESTCPVRGLDAKEDATIEDIFTEFVISKNSITSTKNPYDISLWNKETKTDKVVYTLVVDSTFFE